MIFNEKIVLVTGANRGIGRIISEMFVKSGAIVIGTATSALGVKEINFYLNKQGKGIELDVLEEESIMSFSKKLNQECDGVDILINNAGIVRDNILLRMRNDEWQSVIDVNLTAAYRMCKLVVKSMIRKRYGRIINIGSVVSMTGNIGQVNYAAAKAGLIGLTKSLAQELASRGITVNLVSPGFINTDMISKLNYEQKKNILFKIPMKRFGSPQDVADAVNFLASNRSSYVTGQTIHVNGGMYMG